MAETPPYAKRSKAAEAAEQDRELVRSMRGERKAMLAAGEKWLPKFELETEKRYAVRKAGTPFTNFLGEAVGFAVGQAFQKEPKWQADIPAPILDKLEVIDERGRHANLFLADIFADYWHLGCGLYVVDMPPAIQTADGAPPLKSETDGRLPYWVRYDVSAVLGWFDRYENGRKVYDQLRFEYVAKVKDGEYGEKDETRARCYWAPMKGWPTASYAEWKFVEKAGSVEAHWEELQARTALDISKIPVVVLGELDGKPPLQAVADLNLIDFQNGSVLSNIEKVANIPVPTATGINPDDLSKSLAQWAVDSIVATGQAEATFGYWEHTGACIKELKATIEANRTEMARRSMRSLFDGRGGTPTATSDILQAGGTAARIATSVSMLQDAAESGLALMAEWLALPAGGSVEFNRKFLSLPMKEQGKDWLMMLVQMGVISKEGAFAIAQWYEAIPDSLVYADEKAKIDQDGGNESEIGADGALARRVASLMGEGLDVNEAMEQAKAERDAVNAPPVEDEEKAA